MQRDYAVYPFPSLCPALLRCSRLTAVYLHLWHMHDISQRSIISPLPSLLCLHTLRLTAPLSQRDLQLLLSPHPLPAGSPRLQRFLVTRLSSPLPTPLHLHTLLLPDLHDDDMPTKRSTLWEKAVLSSLTTPQAGTEVVLERLLLSDIEASNFHYIPKMQRVHTL